MEVLVTEEMARLMDEILSTAKKSGNPVVTIPESEKCKDLYITVGNALEKFDYGKWMGGRSFMVYPEGIIFIGDNSFIERMKKYHAEKERKRANEDAQAKLTAFQLKAAKRERWLRIWGVVSTFINIILAYLQFRKS